MHEGFVNYNAGTLGTSMVEGRISAGVVVGDGSDVGGGASIMGTLSGGGHEQIIASASAACSARTPASASRSATTASSRPGTYVTAGTKVTAARRRRPSRRPQLSGQAGLLFRRNSVTGAIEARPRRAPAIALNDVLHAND